VLARGLHVVALGGFVLFGRAVPLGGAWLVGCALAAGLLVWQHRLLAPGDLARIHMAFFTANGAIAILMLATACIDLWVLA
jgi:4-hydroxybenzoate polyprenyltransferase